MGVNMKNKIIKQIIFVFLLFILIFLVNLVFATFLNKLFFENHMIKIASENIDNTFNIDKIICFSSCASDSTINSNNTTTINNLSQFTDIAIFINNGSEHSLDNTLKSVSIKDLSFNTNPTLGTPKLYFKGLTDFAKFSVIEDKQINSELDFSISSEDEIDFSTPSLFNNCANPITLSYVNTNIKNDYTINNTDNSITYDGSLLKKCNILLNDISTSLSFTINIENNLGEHFKCPIYIKIPLEEDSKSIYDGSYVHIYNPNYSFYKL